MRDLEAAVTISNRRPLAVQLVVIAAVSATTGAFIGERQIAVAVGGAVAAAAMPLLALGVFFLMRNGLPSTASIESVWMSSALGLLAATVAGTEG
jgi:hypothetical protein